MENKTLLDFKGQPEFIHPSLEIFNEHEGNWKIIWEKLVKMVKEKKYRAKEDNIVSAYITPTLRNLKLIHGNGLQVKLTSDGKQCLNEYTNQGLTKFKKRLFHQVLKVDQQNVNLIEHLLKNHNSHETSISTSELKEELFNLGIKNAKKPSPVQGWISLLKYLELVEHIGTKHYIVKSQYVAFTKGEKIPSSRTFIKTLKDASQKLKHLTKGTPYIPIPNFRETVCSILQISSFTFDSLLREHYSKQKGIRLTFATPIRKVSRGMIIRNKYYYFIAVFDN